MSLTTEPTGAGLLLPSQVESELAGRISDGEFPPGSRMPAEQDLADSMETSRVAVRTAVGALVRRGVLTLRPGVGTFVSVGSTITNDLREAVDFTVLLERLGGVVGVEFDAVHIAEPTAAVASVLEIDTTDFVVQTAKRLTSDGTTMIYVVNSIPAALLGAELAAAVADDPSISEPLFAFLEQSTGRRVTYQLASLQAELGSDVAHPAADLGAAVPVLRFDEVGFTTSNEPVWHSSSWFPPGPMTFELMRQRSDRR